MRVRFCRFSPCYSDGVQLKLEEKSSGVPCNTFPCLVTKNSSDIDTVYATSAKECFQKLLSYHKSKHRYLKTAKSRVGSKFHVCFLSSTTAKVTTAALKRLLLNGETVKLKQALDSGVAWLIIWTWMKPGFPIINSEAESYSRDSHQSENPWKSQNASGPCVELTKLVNGRHGNRMDVRNFVV